MVEFDSGIGVVGIDPWLQKLAVSIYLTGQPLIRLTLCKNSVGDPGDFQRIAPKPSPFGARVLSFRSLGRNETRFWSATQGNCLALLINLPFPNALSRYPL